MWGNCLMSTWLHYVMMKTSNQMDVVVTQYSECTTTEIVHFQMVNVMLYEFHCDKKKVPNRKKTIFTMMSVSKQRKAEELFHVKRE